MSDENVNKDIKESARNVKNLNEVAEVVKKWKKSLKVINVVSYGLSTNKAKYLKIFKVNDKFINMVKSEEKAKITLLFTYFWLAVLVHFKAIGVILLSNVKM